MAQAANADVEAKRANRVAKEAMRLSGNRSWSAPDAVRETRQQVHVEGRRLDDQIRRREREKSRKLRQANRPRTTASMVERREVQKLATGWFKRHDVGLPLAVKKQTRREREAARKARAA